MLFPHRISRPFRFRPGALRQIEWKRDIVHFRVPAISYYTYVVPHTRLYKFMNGAARVRDDWNSSSRQRK